MSADNKNTHRRSPCDLCGESAFQLIADTDRQQKPLATVICRYCGLVSHQHLPSQDALTEYYQEVYRNEYQGEFRPSGYRVVREWSRGQRLANRLTPHLKTGEKIFEVGSGIGCNLMSLAERGFEVQGIEPNHGYCRFSQLALSAPVEPHCLEDAVRLPLYNTVLLVHVLEHLRSPTIALQYVRQLLQPGGQLYIEVPNLQAPHAAPGKWFHFAHIYNFTAASLTMLAHKTGFRVTTLSAPHERNLCVLLRRVDHSGDFALDHSNYASTLRALNRYNRITYHARPYYVGRRLFTLAARLSERVLTNTRVARIRQRCVTVAHPKRPMADAA